MSGFLKLSRKLLPQNGIFRRIAILSGSTAMAQLIGICALPFVTRLYTPTEIGTVSLFLSFFGFWVNTIALRYEHALLIAADDAESHVVHRLATTLVFLMSLLGVPVLWLLQRNSVLEFQLLPPWTPLITFPILLGSGLSLVYRSWALRGGLIQYISQAAIARSGALAGTKIGLGIFGVGIMALFIAELVGACTSVLRLTQATRKHFAESKPPLIGFAQMRQIGAKYAKFPKLETPSAWLNALAMLLPLPLVTGLYGIEAAGWFGLARMVVSLPNAQIGAAVADVFQIELASAVRENAGPRARELFYTLFEKMIWIGLIPLVGFAVVSPWAFPFVFGQSWDQAGLIAASLTPWLYAAFVVSPLSRALSVLQAQEWKLMYDVTDLCLLVASYFFAKTWSASLIEFCLLLSLAKVLGYSVYAAVLFKLIKNRLKDAEV